MRLIHLELAQYNFGSLRKAHRTHLTDKAEALKPQEINRLVDTSVMHRVDINHLDQWSFLENCPPIPPLT